MSAPSNHRKNVKITVLTMEIKVNMNSEYLIQLLMVKGLGDERNEWPPYFWIMGAKFVTQRESEPIDRRCSHKIADSPQCIRNGSASLHTQPQLLHMQPLEQWGCSNVPEAQDSA